MESNGERMLIRNRSRTGTSRIVHNSVYVYPNYIIIAGSCYIVGAIGAAGLEVILAKIRSRAPAQGDTDATNV